MIVRPERATRHVLAAECVPPECRGIGACYTSCDAPHHAYQHWYALAIKEQGMPGQPEWTREDFMAFIIDHREKPRNHRKMEDASVHVTGGNPGCGDIITMYLKVGPDEKIEDISFVGEGCTISQAGASFMTTRL